MAIEQLQKWLAENNYEALLLSKRNNFSWITGGQRNYIVQSTDQGVASLLITLDRVHLITNNMEVKRIEEEELAHVTFQYEVHTCDWFEDEGEIIRQLTEGKKVASDSYFDDFRVVDEQLAAMRSTLTAKDEERYRTLCYETALAVERAARGAEPGMTEYEVASIVAHEVTRFGGTTQVVLVASDERIYEYRHPIPTDKVFRKHAMVVACVERGGLVANATRFVYVGEPPNELLENRTRLAKIDATMIHHTRPGAIVGNIIKKGIEEYANAGFPDDWKFLHQGGPTGYDSREYLATPKSQAKVRVNQPFTWNPALPGIKSEDTILVKENENHILTKTNEWPYLDVEVAGVIYSRPDLLIKQAAKQA
ncbi:M24 family metallopeptidase [Alteribacter keqinensis]|uniref:M24 family metallopeptidase n=1 Tax=Alteribacter keqinensis TaxID=2483800 RepID=A0A3M7TU59_9BACI|nr:M24 family metallopeptidase [Alteribacter keqinensis]RNA68512.1 M24 family metallopeptidase [Alteribacter keqinensis]